MKMIPVLVSLLLLGSSLAAQTTFTSPFGMEQVGGNATFFHWTGSRRFQQVDFSVTGRPFLINNFAVRRAPNASQNAGGKVFDFTLDLGFNDFFRVSQDLDANYLPGTRVSVVPQTRVNFPDWAAPLPGPTPFDFVVPFPAPFLYPGIHALVIDFLAQNVTGPGGGTTDREFVNPGGGLTGSLGSVLGTGCTASGQSGPFTHEARFLNMGALPDVRFGFRFRVQGRLAPANASVFLFLDTRDQNLAGVACTTLHALPLLSLTLASDGAGIVADTYFGFPYERMLEGLPLYTQLVALDVARPGLAVSLSNARITTVPGPPASRCHRAMYSWYGLPATGSNTVFFGGGMVIQLGM